MRKIVNHPKELRLEGVVESDGIGFLPIRDLGPMSIQTSGYYATIEEDDCIKCTVFNGDESEEEEDAKTKRVKMEDKIKSHTKPIMLTAVIITLVSLVITIVSTSWAGREIWLNVFMTIAYLMLIVMLMPKAAVIFWGRITRNKEMISFSKYLGAKNAVENAYYDLGRAPDMEEVNDYSLYTSECKYTKNGYVACLVLLISVVRFLEGWWYWIAAILAIVILCVLEGKNLLTFWQSFVISKPAEEHYRVAIEAMERTADVIDSLHISYHRVDFTPDPENFNEVKCNGCPAYDFCKDASQELTKDTKEESEEESDNNPVTEEVTVDKDADSEET